MRCFLPLAATNSGDYANAIENGRQDEASRNRGRLGLFLTIRTLQRKVPPLHPLFLGNPASAAHIQGTTFATNRVSNATCLAMSSEWNSQAQDRNMANREFLRLLDARRPAKMFI
jgi:hypothetical protein